MSQKLNKFFWYYAAIILTFNDLLGLFVPKITLRVIYIIIMLILLFQQVSNEKFKIYLDKHSIPIVLFVFVLSIRFIFQLISGNMSAISTTSFIQLIVPIFGFFLAHELSDENAINIEKTLCFCVVASIVLGFVDSNLFKFLPSVGAFSGGLYAYIGNGNVTVRGYSMAGSALSTGFIGALSAVLCIGAGVFEFKYKIIKYVLLFVSLFGCLMTYSRGAIAFFLVTIFVYIYHYFKRKGGRIKTSYLYAILFAIIIVLIVLLINYDKILNSRIVQRLLIAGSRTEGSNFKRYIFQAEAIQSILKKPILGYGFGFSGYQAAVNKVANLINTESFVLSLCVDAGLIAGVLFCVVVFSNVFRRSTIITPISVRYISIVIGMFAWSMMYILLESDLNALFFYYCLGRITSKINTEAL